MGNENELETKLKRVIEKVSRKGMDASAKSEGEDLPNGQIWQELEAFLKNFQRAYWGQDGVVEEVSPEKQSAVTEFVDKLAGVDIDSLGRTEGSVQLIQDIIAIGKNDPPTVDGDALDDELFELGKERLEDEVKGLHALEKELDAEASEEHAHTIDKVFRTLTSAEFKVITHLLESLAFSQEIEREVQTNLEEDKHRFKEMQKLFDKNRQQDKEAQTGEQVRSKHDAGVQAESVTGTEDDAGSEGSDLDGSLGSRSDVRGDNIIDSYNTTTIYGDTINHYHASPDSGPRPERASSTTSTATQTQTDNHEDMDVPKPLDQAPKPEHLDDDDSDSDLSLNSVVRKKRKKKDKPEEDNESVYSGVSETEINDSDDISDWGSDSEEYGGLGTGDKPKSDADEDADEGADKGADKSELPTWRDLEEHLMAQMCREHFPENLRFNYTRYRKVSFFKTVFRKEGKKDVVAQYDKISILQAAYDEFKKEFQHNAFMDGLFKEMLKKSKRQLLRAADSDSENENDGIEIHQKGEVAAVTLVDAQSYDASCEIKLSYSNKTINFKTGSGGISVSADKISRWNRRDVVSGMVQAFVDGYLSRVAEGKEPGKDVQIDFETGHGVGKLMFIYLEAYKRFAARNDAPERLRSFQPNITIKDQALEAKIRPNGVIKKSIETKINNLVRTLESKRYHEADAASRVNRYPKQKKLIEENTKFFVSKKGCAKLEKELSNLSVGKQLLEDVCRSAHNAGETEVEHPLSHEILSLEDAESEWNELSTQYHQLKELISTIKNKQGYFYRGQHVKDTDIFKKYVKGVAKEIAKTAAEAETRKYAGEHFLGYQGSKFAPYMRLDPEKYDMDVEGDEPPVPVPERPVPPFPPVPDMPPERPAPPFPPVPDVPPERPAPPFPPAPENVPPLPPGPGGGKPSVDFPRLFQNLNSDVNSESTRSKGRFTPRHDAQDPESEYSYYTESVDDNDPTPTPTPTPAPSPDAEEQKDKGASITFKNK